MAKGLFLVHSSDMLARESVGFGVPILKTNSETFFPSCRVVENPRPEVIEKVFTLNLTLHWRILGHRIPEWINAVNERMVSLYMRRQRLQRLLLTAKRVFRSLLDANSEMTAGPPEAVCRVRYEARDGALDVYVEGSHRRREGSLILLNEADGTSFNRLRIGASVKEGSRIPGWIHVPLNTVFESPSRRLGFSVALEEEEIGPLWQLAAGREVGSGLDWAGFALMVNHPIFRYRIDFHLL
jgi:hypothetical protein